MPLPRKMLYRVLCPGFRRNHANRARRRVCGSATRLRASTSMVAHKLNRPNFPDDPRLHGPGKEAGGDDHFVEAPGGHAAANPRCWELGGSLRAIPQPQPFRLRSAEKKTRRAGTFLGVGKRMFTPCSRFGQRELHRHVNYKHEASLKTSFAP